MTYYQNNVANVEAFSTQRVYHGTSQEAARSIRKNGFDMKKCQKMDFIIPNQRTVLGSCVYFALDYFKASYIAKQKFGEEAVVMEFELKTGKTLFTGSFCYDWQKDYDSCFLIGKKSRRNFPLDAPRPMLVEYDEIGVGKRIVKSNLKFIACHKVSTYGWDEYELARLEDLVQRRANDETDFDGVQITWNYIATQFPSRTQWQVKKVGNRLLQKRSWTSKQNGKKDWTPEWYCWDSKKDSKKSKSGSSRKWKKNNSWKKKNKKAKSSKAAAAGSSKRKYPESRFRLQTSKISKEDIDKLPEVVQTRNGNYVTKDAKGTAKKTRKRNQNRQSKQSPRCDLPKPNNPSKLESDTSETKGDTLFISIPDALLCPDGYSPAPAELCPKGYTTNEQMSGSFQQTNEQFEDDRSRPTTPTAMDDRVFRSIETTKNKTHTPLPKENDYLKGSEYFISESMQSASTESGLDADISELKGGMQGEAEIPSFVTLHPIIYPMTLQPVNYLASYPIVFAQPSTPTTLFSFCPSPLPKTEPVNFCLNSPEAKEMSNIIGETGC